MNPFDDDRELESRIRDVVSGERPQVPASLRQYLRELPDHPPAAPRRHAAFVGGGVMPSGALSDRPRFGTLTATGIVVAVLAGLLFSQWRPGNGVVPLLRWPATPPASIAWRQAAGLPPGARVVAAHGSTAIAIEGYRSGEEAETPGVLVTAPDWSGAPFPTETVVEPGQTTPAYLVMWLSVDGGLEWSRVGPLPGYTAGIKLTSATWAAGVFVIAGHTADAAETSTLWESADGRGWRSIPLDMPGISTGGGTDSTLFVGSDVADGRPTLASAGDHLRYVKVERFGEEGITRIVAHKGTVIAFEKHEWSGWFNAACTTDGVNWQRATADVTGAAISFSSEIGIDDVGPWHVGNRWVVHSFGWGLTRGGPSRPSETVMTSPDGCSWHVETNLAASGSPPCTEPDVTSMTAVEFDGYLIGTVWNSDSLWTSADGLRWTELPRTAAPGVVLSGSHLFATQGTMLVETDSGLWVGVPAG